MRNLSYSCLVIFFILLVQVCIYSLFLKPMIVTWGALEKEVTMFMVGDSKDLSIASTRSILIHAPKHVVWLWLMQLGADRAGFYSYDFVEKILGYETRYPSLTVPKFQDLKVGDIVKGSMNEDKSIVPYHFRVLYIKPNIPHIIFRN